MDNKNEIIFQFQSKEMMSDNKNSDTTNHLIQDSMGLSSKNPYTLSAINRKFNNTDNLLNDKTSILLSNVSKGESKKINRNEYAIDKNEGLNFNGEEYIRTSFVLEETDNNIINKLENIYADNNENNDQLKFDQSILSLSSETNQVAESTSKKVNNNPYNDNPELKFERSLIQMGICFPGELIIRKLRIKNLSINKRTVIEVKFSESNDIKSHFNNTETNSSKIENSFNKYKCFTFFQGEKVNDKKILLKELEELELDIILNTPFLKNRESLFSILQIFNNKQLIANIPISGIVEIPKLLCLKEIYSEKAKLPLISLMLEIKTKGQRFRLPFKNYSIKDIDIELSLDKKNSLSHFLFQDEIYECQFFFFPATLNIAAQQTSHIDIIAKVKRSITHENLDESKLSSILRKVIISRIKNTNVHYPFFVEVSFKQ